MNFCCKVFRQNGNIRFGKLILFYRFFINPGNIAMLKRLSNPFGDRTTKRHKGQGEVLVSVKAGSQSGVYFHYNIKFFEDFPLYCLAGRFSAGNLTPGEFPFSLKRMPDRTLGNEKIPVFFNNCANNIANVVDAGTGCSKLLNCRSINSFSPVKVIGLPGAWFYWSYAPRSRHSKPCRHPPDLGKY